VRLTSQPEMKVGRSKGGPDGVTLSGSGQRDMAGCGPRRSMFSIKRRQRWVEAPIASELVIIRRICARVKVPVVTRTALPGGLVTGRKRCVIRELPAEGVSSERRGRRGPAGAGGWHHHLRKYDGLS
jgi:hypothetical protein